MSQRKSGQDFCLIVYMYRAGVFFRACDGGHCRQEPSGVRQSFLACGVWGWFTRLRKQMRKLATNATGGKDVVRGRWRRDEDETGYEGLSATGTDSH